MISAAVQRSARQARPAPALQFLKAATRDEHEALEATAVASRVIAPDVTRSDLISFLQANYSSLRSLEELVVKQLGATAVAETWGYSLQVPALEHDLILLDASLPDAPAVDFSSNSLRAQGSLYVLLGSQFGKAVIRRHLQRHCEGLDLDPLVFFDVPQDLAARWRLFGERLPDSSTERQVLLQGASDAFKHFLSGWR